MAKPDINWTYWRTFLSVLERGSLSAAARHLSLTQPTVGHHIDKLETALAAPLFLRSQDGLAPTALALSLKPTAQNMSKAAHALKRLAQQDGSNLSGSVRLSASEIVGTEILPSVLAGFRRDFPDVDLELVLNNRQDDLLNQDVDIAIRMVRPQQTRLIAKKIGTVEIGLYAHEAYFKDRKRPERFEDLAGCHLIGIDRNVDRWRAFDFRGSPLTTNHLSFRCDSDIGQLAALRAGLGLGACQKNIAKAEGDLIAILPAQIQFDLTVWLVMHEDLKSQASVRAVFDYLAKHLPAVLK